jgi:hypothetical protein
MLAITILSCICLVGENRLRGYSVDANYLLVHATL